MWYNICMSIPRIPDGQPMSARTLARRKKEAGLVKVRQPSFLNEKFFDVWSPELAWVVGLIWSDGCLYGNTVDISSKDFQIIELVLALIGGRYALKNRGEHLRVHFSSKHVATFLRSIGLTEKKSLTIAWPKIPVEYEADFMRGLIDGDGSVISRSDRPGQQVPDLRVQLVTASALLRDGVANWLERNNISFTLYVRKDTNPLWRFTVLRQESLRTLYTLLYPQTDSVCLHRKRIPYDLWISTPRRQSGRPKKVIGRR